MAGHSLNLSTIANVMLSVYDRYQKNQQANALNEVARDLTYTMAPEDVADIQKGFPNYGLSEAAVPVAEKMAASRSAELSQAAQNEALRAMQGNFATKFAEYGQAEKAAGRIPSIGGFLQSNPDMLNMPVVSGSKRYVTPLDTVKALGEVLTQGDLDANRISRMQEDIARKQAALDAKDEDRTATSAFHNKVAELLRPSIAAHGTYVNDKGETVSIGGLTDQALEDQKKRGGLPKMQDVIPDIYAYAGEMGVPQDTLDKVLARVTQYGKELYPAQSRVTQKIGKGPGATTTVTDYNLFGEPKKEASSTERPINIKMTPAERDAQTEKKYVLSLRKQYMSKAGQVIYTKQDEAANNKAMDLLADEMRMYGVEPPTVTRPTAGKGKIEGAVLGTDGKTAKDFWKK